MLNGDRAAGMSARTLPGGGTFTLVALVHDLQGWGNLCAFITHARTTAPKGQYHVGPASPFSH